jgi:hypothetical membrane protein
MIDTLVQNTVKRSRVIRLAALGGAIGPILFVMLVIVGGGVYDGYSHVSQTISELGGDGAEYALLQNLNFVMLGLLVIGFSWALAGVLGPPYLGAALIGFFGLSSAIANGLLPCDVGCEGETTVGLLHNMTGLSGFIAAIAGMFILARRWRDDPVWQPHVGFTRFAAFVALGGLAWFVGTQALDAGSFAGIAQRVFVSALLLWIAVTAWKLHRQLEPDESAMEVGAEVVTAR